MRTRAANVERERMMSDEQRKDPAAKVDRERINSRLSEIGLKEKG